jgi:hypothetical protein
LMLKCLHTINFVQVARELDVTTHCGSKQSIAASEHKSTGIAYIGCQHNVCCIALAPWLLQVGCGVEVSCQAGHHAHPGH